MKRSKDNLMHNGWKAMEVLLDEEMPQNKKPILWKALALLAFAIIFISGFFIGRISIGDQLPTAAFMPNTIELTTDLSSSKVPPIELKKARNQSTAETRNLINPSENNNPIQKILVNKSQNNSLMNADVFAYQTESKSKNENSESSNLFSQRDKIRALSVLNLIAYSTEIDPIKTKVITDYAVSYMPRSDAKIRLISDWSASFSILGGINPTRNTKLININSEWRYKLNLQTSIGLSFGVGQEDNLMRRKIKGTLDTKEVNTLHTDPRNNNALRSQNDNYTLNDKQSNYTAGVVINHKINSRLYLSLATGINLLQNNYFQEDKYNAIINEEVAYHPSAYSSLGLGYKVSKFVGLELRGSKSFLAQDNTRFQPGNLNQISAGVNFSF